MFNTNGWGGKRWRGDFHCSEVDSTRAHNRTTLLLSSQARIPFYSSKFHYFNKYSSKGETKFNGRPNDWCVRSAHSQLSAYQLHTNIMKIAKNPIESCSKWAIMPNENISVTAIASHTIKSLLTRLLFASAYCTHGRRRVAIVDEHFVMFHLRGNFIIPFSVREKKNKSCVHVRCRVPVRLESFAKGCINLSADCVCIPPHAPERRASIPRNTTSTKISIKSS